MPAYKDAKRGTWYARFRYTDWTGKRVETTKRGFEKKGDAKKYEDEFLRTAGRAPNMTMKSLCELYIEDLAARRKPTTVYSEDRMIRRHILPHLGELPINQITVSTVREWQNKIMQAKAIYSQRPLSQHTLRNISVCLSSILNFAVRFHGLQSNPVKVAKGMGKASAHLDFWETKEYKKFRAAIDNDADRLFFSVLFTSGMRVGEFLALTMQDVDFEANKITINKTYNWKLKYTSAPKTETSVRTITMPKSVMIDLKKYLSNFYGDPPDRIFSATSQKMLTTRLAKYAEKAGVKKIRLHDLRHSHASYLIHKGVPITAISQRLGHKSPKITLDVYSHVYQASDGKIADILENL
jgi:integrase